MHCIGDGGALSCGQELVESFYDLGFDLEVCWERRCGSRWVRMDCKPTRELKPLLHLMWCYRSQVHLGAYVGQNQGYAAGVRHIKAPCGSGSVY